MRPTFKLALPAQQFLTEYWQKKPLVMRQVASGLDHPDADTLSGLSLESDVDSRLITGHGDGPWNLQHGPFDENDFRVLPRENWTLLVQSVDCFLTEVSMLLDHFSFLPAWRLEDIMISYASRGGSVGPHFDRYDVFLMQAKGQRRWKIGDHCDPHTPLQENDQLKLINNMKVRDEYVLSPGDVLYLPPGVAHWGIAEDSDCITWSVGFRAPSPVDILGRLADQAAESGGDTLFTDPDRTVPSDAASLQPGDIEALTRQAFRALTPDIQRRALAELLSEPSCPSGLDFDVDHDHIAAASPDALLVRHGATRLILDDQGDAWLNGNHWPLTEAAKPLIRLLAGQRLYTEAELQPVTHDDGQDLLDEWIEAGYFAYLDFSTDE